MANEPQKIDGGVFIDTKTDQVVHEKPEEGVQIVPEGGVLDDTAKGLLAAVAGEGAVGTVTSGVVQKATDDEVVETASDDTEVETAADKTATKRARGK